MLNENKMSLTEKVMDYQKTGKGFEPLCEELSVKAYFYPERKLGWNREIGSDFLLYAYPAIRRSVQSYMDQGLSFDHYFNSLLCWQLRAFLRKNKEQNTRWHCTRQEDFWEIHPDNEEHENEQDFKLEKVLKIRNNRIISNSERRQFLFYALKKCRSMTEENTQYLCAVTGYSHDYIMTIVDKLNSTLLGKESRLRNQQRRKNTAFAKMRLLEGLLKKECAGEKKIHMQQKLHKLRLVYSRACHAISRIHLIPTQEAIAAAVGVPKGTVDSAVCAFKKKVLRVY